MGKSDNSPLTLETKHILREIDNDRLRITRRDDLHLWQTQLRNGGATNTEQELAIKYAMDAIGQELARRLNQWIVGIGVATLVFAIASFAAALWGLRSR